MSRFTESQSFIKKIYLFISLSRLETAVTDNRNCSLT